MILIVFLVGLVVVGALVFSSQYHVAWIARLRQSNAGAAGKVEWLAPVDVTRQVECDYRAALHWLQKSVFDTWNKQWTTAPLFLAGSYLRRYQKLLSDYRSVRMPRYIGILHSEHQVDVRHFSEDGERCLIVDCQTQRRMVTYNYLMQRSLQTQALDDGVVVYQMVYDKDAQRWKIEAFVQELPMGWQNRSISRQVLLVSALPPTIGRDH
jgi:hypothetical protein